MGGIVEVVQVRAATPNKDVNLTWLSGLPKGDAARIVGVVGGEGGRAAAATQVTLGPLAVLVMDATQSAKLNYKGVNDG